MNQTDAQSDAQADERPGSGCFYADVDGQVACTVHCCFYPCEKSGQPASAVPVHMGDDAFTREEIIEVWRATTGGQRPLVVHHGGSLLGAEHRVDRSGACWCSPEGVRPDPVIV